MSIFEGIVLGIIQGIGEFLPISSSGHLQLAQTLLGLDEVPLLFDIFLHLATLAAVCLYFWKKIWKLLKVFGRWITHRPPEEINGIADIDGEKNGRKMIIALIISTIITAIIGVCVSKLLPELSIKFVCTGFIVTALLLISSSILEKKQNNSGSENISIFQALIIGLMQGLGTLPGISRSGSTIAGALFSKVDRKLAGEYSFIVSIPAILGAFILELKDIGDVSQSIGASPVITGCAAAFAAGYIALTLLMKIIRKGHLEFFAAYLIPLGILGLIFLN